MIYMHHLSSTRKFMYIIRKLRTMLKMMDHAIIVETTSARNDVTKHGLHLSMTGKEEMANLIREEGKNTAY
jgi:hypothetical protein